MSIITAHREKKRIHRRNYRAPAFFPASLVSSFFKFFMQRRKENIFSFVRYRRIEGLYVPGRKVSYYATFNVFLFHFLQRVHLCAANKKNCSPWRKQASKYFNFFDLKLKQKICVSRNKIYLKNLFFFKHHINWFLKLL